MDARIGRLIVEANEISQCLKKDYVFSTDKTGDSTNSTYVQVISKSLKINKKISITSFKDKLITLRKLMYEDPSDKNLSRADEIIGSNDGSRTLEEDALDQINGNVGQVNLNNCSSSPGHKFPIEDIPKTVKITKSEDKCSVISSVNSTISALSKPDTHHRISTNGKVSDPNLTANGNAEDSGPPKETPRRKSLRRFPANPESTIPSGLKFSEGDLPVCHEKIEKRSNACDCSQTNLQAFLNGCAIASSRIEKDLQDNPVKSHISTKCLQSISEFYETLALFGNSFVPKLTADFGQKCIQAILNLQLMSFIIPRFMGSGEIRDGGDDAISELTRNCPTELLNSLKDFASSFSGIWKALIDNPSDQTKDVCNSLLGIVRQLGSISVVLEYPCPLSSKIHIKVVEEFMHGCDKATFAKLEDSLTAVSQHCNVLQLELNENKEIDGDKTKSMLMFKVFSLLRSTKHLIMIVKQIQEELKSLHLSKENWESTPESLYINNLNLISASEEITCHIGALTKSSSQLSQTADVTILTLKRISKNVSLVEESSRDLSSSYVSGGIDRVMAQDQLESLSEVQSVINDDCLGLRSILLDEMSLGTSKASTRTEAQSSHLQHSFSMLNRVNGKRVLPATPQGDTSKRYSIGQAASDNGLSKNIGQSPNFGGSRLLRENKRITLDHSDEASAFERIDNTNNSIFRRQDEMERSKYEAAEEGKQAFRETTNAFRNHRFRHSFIG